MSKLDVQLCPETGICSILKPDGSKVDLMPDEVQQVADAQGDAKAILSLLEDIDDGFAGSLSEPEISQISGSLR